LIAYLFNPEYYKEKRKEQYQESSANIIPIDNNNKTEETYGYCGLEFSTFQYSIALLIKIAERNFHPWRTINQFYDICLKS
jgi:hypothetical protein